MYTGNLLIKALQEGTSDNAHVKGKKKASTETQSMGTLSSEYQIRCQSRQQNDLHMNIRAQPKHQAWV